VLSVKVKDKSKTSKIQAALEASLGTPALSGTIKGEGSLDKSDIETSTETTISMRLETDSKAYLIVSSGELEWWWPNQGLECHLGYQ